MASNIYNIAKYTRKESLAVNVGGVSLGGFNPIRVQTMTTTNTNSIIPTVEQCIRAINAGAEYVRLTTQGVKEAQSLGLVKKELIARGYLTPIIADIHFNPTAAHEAAIYADKIRINPGNFSDKSRTSAFNFTDDEYERDLHIASERFIELLEVCKKNGVAIRIGVNHGSLSQRIMSRYGDTPMGMACSAIEFVRICAKQNHHRVVVSMKSSNTRVMVNATRCLVKMMADEGLNYPLHLGVTEAGEGEDGRIKSAVGIGTLLVDGIGDTIRVSLTEEPEHELPVAKELVSIYSNWKNQIIETPKQIAVNPFEFERRITSPIEKVGGDNVPVVLANLTILSEKSLNEWGWFFNSDKNCWQPNDNAADYIYIGNSTPKGIVNFKGLPLVGSNIECSYKLTDINTYSKQNFNELLSPCFIEINADTFSYEHLDKIKSIPSAILLLRGSNPYSFFAIRNLIFELIAQKITCPCIACIDFHNATDANFQIMASAIAGPLFIDGLADGIMLCAPSEISHTINKNTSFGILQASRVRISKTEFISCPGCGRTLFSLNDTLLKVKARTSHLKGLKIGVMGCIVNGPGEMADADYGYVGAGPGKVNLYRKKEVVKKNIAEEQAVDELVNLIKLSGDWVEV